MISTSKAISLIESNTHRLGSVTIPVNYSLGYVLTESPKSEINLPPFDQSAMDGYAVRFHETDTFKVIGEIKAGDDASKISLNKGEAVKIFTGGMCPLGCDAVCRIEDIDENNDQITIRVLPKTGTNIRQMGEQIRKGDSFLPNGLILNPAAIGLLANTGVNEVNVVKKPVISIISTGNELVDSATAEKLQPGKIFESNGIMLKTALEMYGHNSINKVHLEDQYELVLEGLKHQLSISDVLIISGGISVGDYDFVGEALLEIGVEQVFYKVNQKPGKPLFFGTKSNKLIFALPGNPAAALTCFYIYVLPALNKLMGKGFLELDRISGKLSAAINKPNSREQFLKVNYLNGGVEILDGQSSAMLRSYAETNALVHLPENSTFDSEEEVTVILL
ncbi:MAG: molybdopterin molybdotransferase MoeA [Flavobacteriales bacterium]|nr:molybdopterin molybdotransferase MoeA [Flavobacteriales bacterium]